MSCGPSGDCHQNGQQLNQPPDLLSPGRFILERAQWAVQTRFGRRVTPCRVLRLTTIQEQEAIRARPNLPNSFKIIFSEPFNQISIITELIGLTGISGLIRERFLQFPRPIGCVINVTYEAPWLQVDGIVSYRIPVDDSPREMLSDYFDEVTEKMFEINSQGKAVVVYCMAGVSRSVVIVIAFLIRHHDMSLEQAFRKAKIGRSFINPNMEFLKQLAQFEAKYRHAEACTRWISHTINGITKQIPEFIIADYLDEYEGEFGE